jgi:Tfp pilus assembly protein PilO
MKVKLLFFPLTITACLALAVWYIQPAFSEASALIQEVDGQEKKLEGVRMKVRNVQSLENDLNANVDSERLVSRYLPDAQDDERIIDTLNYLASQSGVAFADVKLEQASVPAAPAQDEGVGAPSVSGEALLNSDDGSVPAALAKPSLRQLKAAVSVQGEYGNIKDFVSKVYRTDRFQDFSAVEISRESAKGEGSEEVSGNVLHATFDIVFSYLPKRGVLASDSENALFSSASVDFAPARQLQQFVSAPVPQLEVGSAGRANPFVR